MGNVIKNENGYIAQVDFQAAGTCDYGYFRSNYFGYWSWMVSAR
jgi:hypothetical protein